MAVLLALSAGPVRAQTLMDRYSFTTDASDSVGTNNGTVFGAGGISGGMLNLDGNTYLSLPAGVIATNFTALTLEFFANLALTEDAGGNLPTVIAYFGESSGDSFCRLVTKASSTACWTGYQDQGNGEYQSVAPWPIAGNVHLAGVWNPANGYVLLYENGILLSSNAIAPGLPLTDFAGANDDVNLIGANVGPQFFPTGTIDELRIYNGELTIDQIRASMAAGPTNIPLANGTINPGAITSVSVSVHPNFIVGTMTDPTVVASTATVTNINLTQVPDVLFTSGNTNILAVLPNNQVQAVGAGTTTLSATCQGVSNETSVTTLAAPAPAMLTHEYSFTSDTRDSVSAENGTLMGDAAITAGTLDLTLNGDSLSASGTSGAFLNLPRDVITGYPAATVEMWVNLGDNSGFCRLFDVGSWFGGGGDSSAFILSPYWGNPNDFKVLLLNPTVGTDAGDQEAASPGDFDNAGEVQIVGVCDPVTLQILELYTNGTLAATAPTTYSLLAVSNQFAAVGVSFSPGNPFVNGYVDEIRLYYGALSAAQIAADYQAGPNSTNGSPGVLESLIAAFPSTLTVGAVTNITVTATYASVGNINVTPAATLASSNTAIISVTGGAFTAVAVGSTTISASYGGLTVSQLVSVVPANPAVLMDRYSFTTDASDSVGTNNGTLQGDAVVSGRALVLDGNAYVSLPAATITANYTALTMEIFANVQRTADGTPTVIAYLGNSAGSSYCRMVTKANSCNCWIGYAANGIGEFRAWPPGPIAGNVHLVGVFNPADGYMLFYKNGILIASNSIAAGLPLTDMAGANDQQSYIGANQNGGIPPTGTIDEFRIYNGALTIDQIRASLAAGPDNLPLVNGTINPGAMTNVSVSMHPNFIVGTLADPVVVANTASVTNINLTCVPDVAFTSGNSNVFVVLANNQVEAVGVGTATLTATYQGVSNSTQVSTIPVPTQPLLTHRYSFTSDASDSVGGENGTLLGGAGITSGSLDLTGNGNSGNAGGTSGAYLGLPRDVITGYPAASVEMWVNLGPDAGGSRLWYVGSSDNPGDTSAFILSPSWNGTSTELILNPQVGTDPGNDQAVYGSLLAGLGEVQIVGVASPSVLQLYLNGSLAASGANSYSLLSVSNQFVTVGQAVDDNPYVNGTIDEIRLYYGALSAAQIAADAKLGPSSVVPPLTVALSGQSVLISWPAASTGFTLYSSPALGGPTENWQPVGGTTNQSGGVLTQSVLLTTNSARFFRLVN